MKIGRCRSELHNIRCFRLHGVTHRTRVGWKRVEGRCGGVSGCLQSSNPRKLSSTCINALYPSLSPNTIFRFHARRYPQIFSAGSNSANNTKASRNDKTHVGRTSSLSITRLINACITPLRWKR
ncbi:hypothetical protein M404DRAFT_1008930 [Pisolithus tinctorius Marx 270]|uniref:Uncharacterized protein n=1 Tax=Pisolithus tinctorius Marx 270 TaxID=870435 RepID=A0A0C3J6Z1_PISTI|nr:hypothetical protein M404DRAFT_1008930 [Pisolithus tinctorius Marx 270]